MPRVVHITHEAVKKVGGIGAVLEGLLTSPTYRRAIDRTILLGPLFDISGKAEDRLGPGGKVYYSSLDGVFGGPHPDAFRLIEERHGVRIVQGDRNFVHPETGKKIPVETVLIDVSRSLAKTVNKFKFRLWERFGLNSARHDVLWEYELYLRLAEPGYEAVRQLLGQGGPNVFISHDFMGMGTLLKVLMDGDATCKTIFHAHEVATARVITESSPGHDTMFYNVLAAALREGSSLEDIWGLQDHFFKHPLFRLSHRCNAIFAVGDLIRDEFRFLAPEFRDLPIDCVYNGVPAEAISWEERSHSRGMLQQYAEALVGFRPDYIFTHVARPVLSKAFWRDFQVLLRLDRLLRRSGRRAVYFLLASEGGARRSSDDVTSMVAKHGWPLFHRFGLPDLTGNEVTLNDNVQSFNLVAKNIRAVFVNQYGWGRSACGPTMPEEMQSRDLRRGTDVELGLSVYEPFGIAVLEPLTCGAISVISSVCGCRGFLREVDALEHPNVLIGDFTRLAGWNGLAKEYLKVDRRLRDFNEGIESQRLAEELFKRLSTEEKLLRERLESGYELASRMSWETVVREQFLPGLRHTNV